MRLESAGGVSSNIVEALRAVLQDSSLDGAFVSAAITLPASTELRDDIPNLNPVLLYQVRSASPLSLSACSHMSLLVIVLLCLWDCDPVWEQDEDISAYIQNRCAQLNATLHFMISDRSHACLRLLLNVITMV